ncbi:uncharacterized protein [Triticum aestivum]|uniref:uncharacterized protein n=1 Tax=Triticum aestivum TaxID=4565 RepID=UPI001D01F409|nr:uncharacterized protein LOC123166497 [Triticum aestivum]
MITMPNQMPAHCQLACVHGTKSVFIRQSFSAHGDWAKQHAPPMLATPLRSLEPHLWTAGDDKGKNEDRDEHCAGTVKRYKARSWRRLHHAPTKPARRMRPPRMDGPHARKRTRSPRLTGTAHMPVSGFLHG